MSKTEIDGKLAAWIRKQPLFFVGTAPSGADGHVNVSPKGLPQTFEVLGPRRVAYVDTVGSGIETIAHLRENGRIVIMFCAFSGPPRIVRLHGSGSATQIGEPGFEELLAHFDLQTLSEMGLDPALRSVIVIDVRRVADSCGYGVPLMSFEGWRSHLGDWADNRLRKNGPSALLDYTRTTNAASIDGLPGIEPDRLPHDPT